MKNAYCLVFAFFFYHLPVQAQLQKGDVEIAINTTHRYGDNQYSDSGTASLFKNYILCGKMTGPNAMVGLGLEVLANSTYISFYGKQKYQLYKASPFFRYYFFEIGRLHCFGFARAHISHFSYKNEDIAPTGGTVLIEDSEWGFQADGGFGAQYFLSPNVAIHSEMSTFLFESANGLNSVNLLSLDLGVRLFLNDRTKREENLEGRYLKKGNYMLSGSMNLTSNDNQLPFLLGDINLIKPKPMQTNFVMEPKLTYFAKNRLAISDGPGFQGSWNGTQNITNYSLNLGSKTYFPIARGLYFAPSLDIALYKGVSKTYTIEGFFGPLPLDTVRQKFTWTAVTGTSDISLVYFTKMGTIISSGYMFSLRYQGQANTDFSRSVNSKSLYVGMEHFFTKNLSLAFRAAYRIGFDTEQAIEPFQLRFFQDDLQSLNTRFTINYIISK